MKGVEGVIPNARWYLIHSKPRQETLVELNLSQLGVQTFCPRVKARELHKQKGLREEILFPGYLFIKVDMTMEYRKVSYAQGVLNVVKIGVEPAVVEEDIINSIRERINQGLIVLSGLSSLKYGQMVRINTGPFEGFEAIFERELNGTQRVALLLKTVAFQGHMVLDRHCVGL
jgi:transcriptional antiterminator RfaH